jgi:DNA-binding CsgD family transcriptional regulator
MRQHEDIPVHYYEKDLQGKYCMISSDMAFWLNLHWVNFDALNDMVGLTDYDIPRFFTSVAAAFQNNDQEVYTKKKSCFFVEPSGDPAYAYALTRKSPIKTNSGKIIGISGCSTLISHNEYNHSLTEKQIECLVWLVQGLSTKQIGIYMHLSCRTVEHYLESIKEKLQCYTRAQLIKAAWKIMPVWQQLLFQNGTHH